MVKGSRIRQLFKPQACEILTDELEILVPLLFVPLIELLSTKDPQFRDIAFLRCPCGGMSRDWTPGGRRSPHRGDTAIRGWLG